ncbi:MAG: ABC transporter ATP-binding protein [Sporichthyaceae bacterium]
MDKVVEVANLDVRLGGYPVFAGVDVTVPAGEILAVLGDIGSGKTTLLKVLGGVVPFESGSVRVLGRDPKDPSLPAEVVLVAGEPDWEPGATVLQILELARLQVEDLPEDWPIPPRVLETFELAHRADDEPFKLSQGLRQRLALARAFCRPSRLLLIDDPEFGLDERFRPLLAELLSGYAARGGTVVLGTHDLDLAVAAKARTFSLD